ncbi:MAG TPA: hypothetical protein VJP80_07050 [Candidatus Saccharimonadales bacterium]|nr:hypothetical protein [Candidatus Saccharimonadales bacterium]
MRQRSATQKTAFIFVLACCLSALSFAAPEAKIANPHAAHTRTAVAIFVATTFTGAALWFLAGLHSFKAGLRTAYRLLAVSMILFSVAYLQLPIIGLYDWWNSAWVNSGGVILPFVAAALFLYVGVRRFARELQMQSVVRKFWLITLLAIVLAAVFGAVAHQWGRYQEQSLDTYIAVVAFALVYMAGAMILMFRITKVIGQAYHGAMRLLSIALAALAFAAAHEIVSTFAFPSGTTPYEIYGIYLWPSVLTGILFVRASRAFSVLIAPQEAAAQHGTSAPATDRDYIDSIIAVAGLASRPDAIDPMLDTMRVITSRGDNAALTPSDKQQLVGTYNKLEAYLMRDDPLRTFTKQELRSQIAPAFRSLLSM